MSTIKFNKDAIYITPDMSDFNLWHKFFELIGGESKLLEALNEYRNIFPHSMPEEIVLETNMHFNGVPIAMRPPEETGAS